ncbi:rabphilin-3A [Schistocerca piceifrons]|uniref:rabphilin-3A n=1 Tax=Schistocerca piceifrons TaxID=274613 RepID=UPI001F5F2127|nr:rabphilin-3A [Schistocerca piceifrons]
MVDFGNTQKDRWVCPNDRQLALRAKLRTGWSVKTQSLEQYGGQADNPSLSEQEQETILQVIRRAEMLDLTEQERVGRLVERLENMKRNALGNGTSQCVLCGETFGVLGSPSLICHDCKKAVCQKCGFETFTAHKEPISLCKICSETREMWKKSGAWFFKGLPKYVLPEKKTKDGGGKYGVRRIQRPGLEKNSWSRAGRQGHKGGADAEEESSSEEEVPKKAYAPRTSILDSAPTGPPPTDTSGSNSSSGTRQGSLAAGEPSLRATSPGVPSQRSESLSLASDGDLSVGQPGSDTHRAMAYLGASTDFYQSETASMSSVMYSRQSSINQPEIMRQQSLMGMTTNSLSASNSLWEATVPNSITEGPEVAPYSAQRSPSSSHMRRDSQASSTSRDWYLSDDRTSIGSSSVSGQHTSSTTGDTAEDFTDSAGENVQLGKLELSLLYDSFAGALHCSLHRAKGLKPMDINGLSDPFCRLSLIPAEGRSNTLRTKTVHKTRNPEFNETLTFYAVSEEEINRKILHIVILDDDKYGNDFIGEAHIPLSCLKMQQMKHFNVPLEKQFLVEQGDNMWNNDAWTRGQILVTLCYSTKKKALIVGIVRCANLIPMDNNGFSDPFVKLRLKPDPYHRKHKTSIKWKNLNPVFNEEFAFDTKMTDLPKQELEITVWDKDYGKSNDYLGGLELSCRSKGERLKHWVDMIKFPDHKHEGWHNLGEELLGD